MALALTALTAEPTASAQDLTENFDNVATLAGKGWSLQNLSSPLGTTGWFQGTPAGGGGFDSQTGAPNAYIGANFNNTGNTGTISNWLETPEISLANGDVFTFYTRKVSPDSYADRLELRLSTNGSSTNAGSSASSVGDFSTLLLTINPTLVLGVYPTTWTQYSVTINGLSSPVQGRIAFRYFVTNGGLSGGNSDYIGIDTVSYFGTQYWNGTTTSADGTVHGGDGTWDNSLTNWTNVSGTTSSSWSGINGVFSGSSGTVNVATTVAFSSLDFQTDYTLQGQGSLSASGSNSISVSGSAQATIATTISGTGSLTKLGPGTLSLTGSNSLGGGAIVKSGTLKVDGTGVLNTGTSSVVVGQTGGDVADLAITNGGLVSNGKGVIGAQAGSSGTVTVTSGTWQNSGDLSIGQNGTGSLLINGGLVTDTHAYVGENGGSYGSVTVTSGTWKSTAHISIGRGADATLLINGGYVESNGSYIGFGASSGTATVTSGTWNDGQTLNVGYFGNGVLVVDGGYVATANVNIGTTDGSSGTATVTSGTVAFGSALGLGYSGTGTLQVNGGLVSGTDGFVGQSNTGVGVATVSSGTLALEGDFNVGYFGTGTMALSGGLVTDKNGYLGQAASGVGTAVVTGGTWNNTAALNIGVSGTGFLNQSAGLVTAHSIAIGVAGTSYGVATVTGGTLSSNTYLQMSGTSTLNVSGGLVSTGSASNVFLQDSATINLSGTVGGRGVLLTQALVYNSGTVALNFDGGILQASTDSSSFVGSNISTTLLAGGGFIDSNGFSVGIQSSISGTGGLTKIGLGTLTLSGSSNYTGNTTVKSGTLAVDAGIVDSGTTGNVIVGEASGDVADLVISTGGYVSGSSSYVGSLAGSVGTATVSSGTWNTISNLIVGDSGTGILNVTGGLVSNNGLFVGNLGGSSGMVTLTSGTIQSTGLMSIAESGGTGTLIVNGGLLSTADTYIADYGGVGTGTVTSGTWNNSGNLLIGAGGQGTLTIDGGLVSTGVSAQIGLGGVGQVTVTSGTFQNTGALVVGNTSTGSLLVTGGLVSGSSVYIGNDASGNGTVTLADSGSLVVNSGSGLLTIGATAGSRGDLIVGTGSTAGVVSAGTIAGGAGTANVIFNHNEAAYNFASNMGGTISVQQNGPGTTVFSQDQQYSGATIINAGTLESKNLFASNVIVTGSGNYSPGGTSQTVVNVGKVTLSGGNITMDLATPLNSDVIFSGSAATITSASSFFLRDAAYTPGLFTLIVNVDPLFDLNLLSYTTDISGLVGGFHLLNGNLVFGITLQPGQLDNAAGTPTGANYNVINGSFTGPPGGSNAVAGLVFAPDGTLTLNGPLSVTNGLFDVQSGTGVVLGSYPLSTPGDFTKTGAGLLNFLANVVVGGSATITQGGISVNGNFTVQDLIVQLGAYLKGSGFIFGNVINNGLVAPGKSPGTLTINGNYSQSSSGALDIEIASTSLFDQLIVSGNASLAGTLNVIAYNGFNFQYGQKFKFLQAGSISGSFDSINLPGHFRGRILEKNDALTLLVAPQSYVQVAETQNQKNVAKALNSFISATKGDKLKVSTALDKQTAGEYPAAFNAIAPTFFESLGNTTIELANAQNQVLAQRMSAVRLGVKGFSSVGMQMVLANDKDGKSVMDAKGEKDILKITPDTKWGVWVQGNGIFAKVTNVSDVPNYRYQSGGFSVGADYAWNEHFSTGLYTGYQGTYAKYGNGGVNTINSALFGLYATYAQDGFYSNAILGGSYNGYSTRRPIQFSSIDRTATANPNGGQFSTYLDAGYDIKVSKFTFGPLVAGQYTYAGIAPFTEQGAKSLDLKVNQQNVNSLRMNLGGRVAYTWNLTDQITVTPEGRLFWQHEFLNNSRSIGASLDGGSGPSFNYQTANPGRDSVLATAGVSAQFGARWNGNFYYTADFGNQSFLSHMISTGLEWKF